MKMFSIILETFYKILLIIGSSTAAYFTVSTGLGETMMVSIIVGSYIALITSGMLFSQRIQRELHNVRTEDNESLRSKDRIETEVNAANETKAEPETFNEMPNIQPDETFGTTNPKLENIDPIIDEANIVNIDDSIHNVLHRSLINFLHVLIINGILLIIALFALS